MDESRKEMGSVLQRKENREGGQGSVWGRLRGAGVTAGGLGPGPAPRAVSSSGAETRG